MSAGLIAPFGDLVAEGYHIYGIGADVIGLAAYVKQRLEVIQNEISALPTGHPAGARSPYA
jgi:hypothetical protein